MRDANPLTEIRSTSEHTYRLGSNNVLLPDTIEVCHTFNCRVVWLCRTWCEYYFRRIAIDKICNLLYKEIPKYIIFSYTSSSFWSLLHILLLYHCSAIWLSWLTVLPTKTGMLPGPTFAEQPPPLTPILFTLTIIPTYYQVSKMCWIAPVPWPLWGKAIGSQFPKFLLSPTHMEHESRHSIQSHHKLVTTHTHTYVTHTFNKIWNQSILYLHVQLSPVQRWCSRVVTVRWAKQYCTSITWRTYIFGHSTFM